MNNEIKGVIIYGPQGCGKTKNAQAFAELFGCETVVDWYPDMGIRALTEADDRTLILTQEAVEMPGFDTYSFGAAMSLLRAGKKERWEIIIEKGGVSLRRHLVVGKQSKQIESYPPRSKEKAIVDLVAIIQGFEPIRGPLRDLDPQPPQIQTEHSFRRESLRD